MKELKLTEKPQGNLPLPTANRNLITDNKHKLAIAPRLLKGLFAAGACPFTDSHVSAELPVSLLLVCS
jgi:hypothetical protein